MSYTSIILKITKGKINKNIIPIQNKYNKFAKHKDTTFILQLNNKVSFELRFCYLVHFG